jgi:hypothetical protein
MIPLRSFLLLLGCSLAAAADAPAPAVNWTLPLYTDKEGYHSMTLRGSEVRPVGNSDAIAVADLNVTVFSGDAAAEVETLLLSPSAIFYPKEKRASGSASVRVIRDDFEARGTRWSYDHERKRVTLDGDVRIVFNAQLQDVLK